MQTRLAMRQYREGDRATIADWPAYPAEFTEVDYALREQGWLAEYADRPDTHIYLFEEGPEAVAFSLLAHTAAGEAEFRIALRADCLGQGLGAAVTYMTLTTAFHIHNLTKVHLIVRRTHHRAIALYLKMGFISRGECTKTINGKTVALRQMELYKDSWMQG